MAIYFPFISFMFTPPKTELLLDTFPGKIFRSLPPGRCLHPGGSPPRPKTEGGKGGKAVKGDGYGKGKSQKGKGKAKGASASASGGFHHGNL